MSKRFLIQNLIMHIVCAFGLLYSLPTTFAETYRSGFNIDSWKASSSVMRCQIVQKIPMFGRAVAQTRAGESSNFYLSSDLGRLRTGKANLIALSPVWSPTNTEMDMGRVSIKSGRRVLSLNSALTEELLKKLNNGVEIGVSQKISQADGLVEESRVIMNTVGFRREYRKYLRCLSNLIPKNFDQLKRTSLYFPKQPDQGEKAKTELPASVIRKLDYVLTLVKHDKEVKAFYIDGHTDNDGMRAKNLDVSKMRAEKVAGYLMAGGIPKDEINVRWHGERYPVTSNGSDSGRAKNRRVTLRLERGKKMNKENNTMSTASK